MLGSKKIQNNENSDLSPVNILKIKLFIYQRKITPKKQECSHGILCREQFVFHKHQHGNPSKRTDGSTAFHSQIDIIINKNNKKKKNS